MAYHRSRNKVFLMSRVIVEFDALVSRSTAIAFNIPAREMWMDRQLGSAQEK
ncbi:hypothetical protein ACJJIL_07285 [Microbulbifer sp. EKSA005]|uniref:hypothetical protein n=1 Tax=Microbulbifer sp. EKSA005 TaxID=3243364 RepID=UPI0040438C40